MSNYDFFEPKFVGIEKDIYSELVIEQKATRFTPCKQEAKQANTMPVASILTPKHENLPFGYFYIEIEQNRKKGIYKTIPSKDETSPPSDIRIGDLLYFKGLVRDKKSKNWAFLCSWKDQDNKEHLEIIPFEKTTSINADWFTILSIGGYRGNKKELAKIFQDIEIKERITLVNKNGWHDKYYILPKLTISHKEICKEKFFLNSSLDNELYTQKGSYEDWKKIIALCNGNSRLCFSLLVSLSSPLLALCDLEGGFFSFMGSSSSGKTTALYLASSVWGSREHIRQWRTTSNALEGLAVLHNDNVLILDELGQANAKDVDEAIYLVANGIGKSRADKFGDSRQAKKWNVQALSSGEISISQKLAEIGKKARAGQVIRYIDIPTEQHHMANLNGASSAQELIDTIKKLTSDNYGFAGIEFVQYIVNNYDSIKNTLPVKIKEIAANLYSGEKSQVLRIANRFALLECTRRLSIKAGIMPENFAIDTVQICFTDWLNEQSNSFDTLEEAEILESIKTLIFEHEANFQDIRGTSTYINPRYGFKEISTFDKTIFYIPVDEIEKHTGKNRKTVGKCLKKYNWLALTDKEKNYIRKSFGGLPRLHYYPIVLPEDGETQTEQP